MAALLRKSSILFALGAFGGLVTAFAIWLAGLAGVTALFGVPIDKLKNAGKFFLFPERDERILLICDQSLLGSCKEGFALTERGLYWKAQLQTARKVAYTALESVRREKDWLLINGDFFHANPSLDLKMMKLLKKLQLR